MTTLNITKVFINGRRWFQKSYGNTYNTTKTLVVYSDGTTKQFFTPMQYGYGEHYKDLAIQNLVKENILPKIREGNNWYHMDFKEYNIEVYSSHRDVLKRDLHK